MDEATLLRKVREEAKRQGWLCYHTHRSDRSEKGFPDLVMVRRNLLFQTRRVIFVELKSKTGKLTDEQWEWFEALASSSAGVYVWRPEHWYDDTIRQVLDLTGDRT